MHNGAMRRSSSRLPVAAAIGLALGSAAQAAPPAYLPPTAEENAAAITAFRDAAARSVNDRGGDYFYLPAKYSYVVDDTFAPADRAHLRGEWLDVRGTEHGASWDYDTRIPLILWGPGFVKAGHVADADATQQDLVPTFAALMGATPPEDALGRVLSEALTPTPRRPKLILTVVFDQAGEAYFRAHPGVTPTVGGLKAAGTDFARALVTHLDVETGIGHTAIGTGAWPTQTGLGSNIPWIRGFGEHHYSFNVETAGSPVFQGSPTLADVWLRQTRNQALVAGMCYADRAAIGMVGHGSLFRGNKKPWVVFYDSRQGMVATNPAYYALPPYLAGRSPAADLKALTGGTGNWMGQVVDPKDTVRRTPAYVQFDGDNALRLIDQESWGQDAVTDLMYLTFKSTDAAGHAWGFESDEAGAVLAAQDRQLKRVIDALVAKVGRDDLVVAFTADHGSAPLTTLSGGRQLRNADLVKALNAQLGAPIVQYATAAQLFIDKAAARRHGVTDAAIAKAILDYPLDGRPFFIDALSRDAARQRARELQPRS